MKQKDFRVSDAIPEMPQSFDRTVEQTLAKVCTERKTKATGAAQSEPSRQRSSAFSDRKKQRRIQIFAYSAAAVLLVCVLALGGIVVKNAIGRRINDPIIPAATPAPSEAVVPAIRYHGVVYVITDHETAGEPDESAIRRTTDSPVPMSQWPTEEGQTNFGETSYAMTIDGLVVLYGSEWRLFEPLLPDADKGVFEAAYAQVLLERYEYDRTYDARRAKMETMSEEDAQDYDTIMEGEENFLHQRFVRLQRICEVTVSVEQQVDRMRLSEIAYLDGRMYFAFAATKVWAFDTDPVICINGTQYHAIDDSGFFSLKETETEQYAFYEIEPGTLFGTVLITVKNSGHTFLFMYNVDENTIAPAQDDATMLSDVSYYFLVNSVPVYPYEGFLWESKPELEADGAGVQFEDEKVRSRIPVTEYNPGMPFVVLTADGWKLDEIIVFDTAYERIVDVAGSGIPWEEGNGYVATDLLETLSSGTYYVSAIVSYRAENYSKGNEIAICLKVGAAASDTPAPIEETPAPETSASPSTFRFWDYDEENGYREAPESGVLFVCDFNGDGTEDEVAYKIHGQYLTISLGKKSIDVSFGAELEQAILLDLDSDSARLNLLVVYNTGSEDYETAELHMENGRFVRGPVIYAYCTYDGKTLRGSATQTDILGTKTGERTYHGENLTPDSEWYDCDVIPDEIQSASDRARLIEGGKLLHLVRDLPCTIDGADTVIPAGSYIYMTRWHESGTLAEIRTEDGTTALVTVERADHLDPDLYGYLIDGATQDTYFDNIFYAD